MDLPRPAPLLEPSAINLDSASVSKRPLIPTIPILDADTLLPTLQSYMAALQQTPAPRQRHKGSPPFLFPHATTSAPDRILSKDIGNILSDLFPSVRALEKATRSSEGKAKLRDWVDAGTADEIIDFWEDEWIV